MANQQIQNIRIDNAQLRFRNFAGAPDAFNKAGGKRTFCVLLDPGVASAMARDGWNVKVLHAREEGDVDQPYIQVEASYKVRAPKIFMITSRGQTPISEGEIGMLDWVEIANCDLALTPYVWQVREDTGIKAYLDTMYITIIEDELAQKYANVPFANNVPTGPAED